MISQPTGARAVNTQDAFAYFLMSVSALCLIAAIYFVIRQFTGETEITVGKNSLKTSVVGVAFLAGAIGFAYIGLLLLTGEGPENGIAADGSTTTQTETTTSAESTTTTLPAPTTTIRESNTTLSQVVVVPELEGLHIDAAIDEAASSGIAIGEVIHVSAIYNDPAGTVTFQSIQAGLEVARTTIIDLNVAVTLKEFENLIWAENDTQQLDVDTFDIPSRGPDLALSIRPNPDANFFIKSIEPTADSTIAYAGQFESGFHSGVIRSCEEELAMNPLDSIDEEALEIGGRICVETDKGRIAEIAIRQLEPPGSGPFIMEFDAYLWTLR